MLSALDSFILKKTAHSIHACVLLVGRDTGIAYTHPRHTMTCSHNHNRHRLVQVRVWPPVFREISAVSGLPGFCRQSLPASHALCVGTNAVYASSGSLIQDTQSTQLKTHSSLPISNFILQTCFPPKIHTTKKI